MIQGSTWLAALAVCFTAIVPFLSTFPSYFLGDDFGLIQLFSQKPPLHFLSLFTSPWTENIYGYRADELRPLVALSYQVDALWGPASPIAYHVSNILFHTLNALLVLAIARQMAGLSLPGALFSGVLFAVMPVHVETVAWISGRADSIPALFYLSSLLTYGGWRRSGRPWMYGVSVVTFFLALFSKQTAITMLATLVLYEVLVESRRPWRSWAWVWGYAPYAALTLCYLALRFVLFDNVVREQWITVERLAEFWQQQGAYLQMVVSGLRFYGLDGIALALAWGGVAIALYAVYVELRRRGRGDGPTRWGVLLYFGPVWWMVSVAPLLVANYLSARHLYLASAGLAIVFGLGLHVLWGARRRLWRNASILAGLCLVLGFAVTLLWAVGQWNAGAALSEKMARDVQHQAVTAPTGSLLVLGAPPAGTSPIFWTWVWGFALPFALQPPFAPTDPTERVSIVSRPEVYCCLREQWYARTQRSLAAWSARTDSPPVMILAWDNSTGALIRRSDLEQPQLRSQVLSLAGAPSAGEMSGRLDALLRQLGGSQISFRLNKALTTIASMQP